MIKQGFLKAIAISTLVLATGLVWAADKAQDRDIRGLRIGMSVQEVTNKNFERVNCAQLDGAGQQVEIKAVSEFKDCLVDSDGLSSVQVHYAAIEPWNKISDRFQGTKLAGHPVNLYLRISSNGTLRALLAETDSQARRYLRKKAFLLSIRIKGRYGRENWTCKRDKPTDEKQRVGGMFIDEICEKKLEGRRLLVHTRLYREAGQEAGEFIGATKFEILGPDVQSS